MPVFSCRGCGKLISLSIIPGGNPAATDPQRWARVWRRCAACGALFCEPCNPGGASACAACDATEVRTPDADTRLAMYFPPAPPPPELAPDAAERTWQEDLAIAIRDGLPVLPGVRVLASGVPDLAHAPTWERYLRWIAVRSWLLRAEPAMTAHITISVGYRGVIVVRTGQAISEWGRGDPYGPEAMDCGGRWADPAPEDCLAFALRHAATYSLGPIEPAVQEALHELARLECSRN